MCQSYKVPCTCDQNTAEIFFGKCVLNETGRDLFWKMCVKRNRHRGGLLPPVQPEYRHRYRQPGMG
jgi:hypothetical protein